MGKTLSLIKESEIKISAIKSQGPGGQHVNKTSSAIHLRFDVRGSSLPLGVKNRLLANPMASITQEGVLIMKTQSFRSQEMNRLEALTKLHALIEQALIEPKIRLKTKPTRASKQRRLESKKKEGLKKLHERVCVNSLRLLFCMGQSRPVNPQKNKSQLREKTT